MAKRKQKQIARGNDRKKDGGDAGIDCLLV